jgi:integrase
VSENRTRALKTYCPRNHELTEDNLRRRTGRSGRECLICARESAVQRQRDRWAVADKAVQNQIRTLRARAQKMGLTVAKQGEAFTVSDGTGSVFVGSLAGAETWIGARFVGKPPGLARYDIPELWLPWIELLVKDLRAARRSPDTIRLRVERLAAVARACPDSDPLTITRAELVDYMAANHSWTPEYAHSVRTTLRVFFGLLQDLELRPHDPARRLPRIRIPRGVPRPCPDGAIREALHEVTDSRLRLAIRLGAEAGLRRMEIATLRRDDIEGCVGDFRVHIRRGKGGHARVVPIADDLAQQLRASGDGSSAYLFPSPAGGHVTPAHLGTLIRKALPDRWSAHTLRHRYATVAYQSSGDLRAVQELLGHQSPATTAIYTRVADESIRRAAAATRL